MDIIHLVNCGKEIIYRCINKSQKSSTYNRRWNHTYFLFGVYSLTCVLVFFVNTLVPASSPRVYMSDKYIHKLHFTGVADYLQKKCKDNRSANSFPSGHVAETICISFAYLGMGKKAQGFILLFFASMVLLATLFLRYHYFCDLIMAILIAYVSFLINYHFGFKKYLNEMREINSGEVTITTTKKLEVGENSEKKDDKTFGEFGEEV